MHFPDLQVKELGLHAVPVKKTEKNTILLQAFQDLMNQVNSNSKGTISNFIWQSMELTNKVNGKNIPITH